jgi:predicted transposase/invertase (TIGR01784 family)
VFGHPETALAHFRAYLPPALVARLDAAKATLRPGSYVDEELAQRHSDLLYRVRLDGGEEAFLYVLFEHQSGVDPWMAFRLLRYLVRIWDRALADDAAARRLPPIVPLVLYHGRERWTAATRFAGLLDFDPPEWRAIGGLDFACALTDVSRLQDADLRGAALGRLALFLLRDAGREDFFVTRLPRWVATLREVFAAPSGLNALRTALRYVLEVGENVTPEALGGFVAREVAPEAREVVMTAAQKLREEGREEGRRSVLLRQLALRFGTLPAEVVAGVERADGPTLDRWAERVLSAATLDEVLAR